MYGCETARLRLPKLVASIVKHWPSSATGQAASCSMPPMFHSVAAPQHCKAAHPADSAPGVWQPGQGGCHGVHPAWHLQNHKDAGADAEQCCGQGRRGELPAACRSHCGRLPACMQSRCCMPGACRPRRCRKCMAGRSWPCSCSASSMCALLIHSPAAKQDGAALSNRFKEAVW